MVQKSLLFRDFDVSTIPPCIEEKEWTPLEKNASRKILEIDDVINRKNVVNGLIPARKKGKLCWANVNPSILEDRQS